MKRWLVYGALGALGLMALPGVAHAATGFVPRTTDLYAGPGDYPNVAAVPSGATVNVIGCTSSFHWCDISYRSERGWIPGGQLLIPYHGREVAIMEYGNDAAVPIVAFEFNPYWNDHYRDRDFYRERERWAQLRAEEHARWREERRREDERRAWRDDEARSYQGR